MESLCFLRHLGSRECDCICDSPKARLLGLPTSFFETSISGILRQPMTSSTILFDSERSFPVSQPIRKQTATKVFRYGKGVIHGAKFARNCPLLRSRLSLSRIPGRLLCKQLSACPNAVLARTLGGFNYQVQSAGEQQFSSTESASNACVVLNWRPIPSYIGVVDRLISISRRRLHFTFYIRSLPCTH
jgi:hypothetical protein